MKLITCIFYLTDPSIVKILFYALMAELYFIILQKFLYSYLRYKCKTNLYYMILQIIPFKRLLSKSITVNISLTLS